MPPELNLSDPNSVTAFRMYSLSDSTTANFPTVTLSDATADLHATVAPTVGMIVCSLRHRGE